MRCEPERVNKLKQSQTLCRRPPPTRAAWLFLKWVSLPQNHSFSKQGQGYGQNPQPLHLSEGQYPLWYLGVPGREARVQASLEARVEDSWDKKGLSQTTREQNLCSDRLSIQQNAYNQMLKK